MADLAIGGLAKAAGVGVETVRYYQRRGLIDTPPRPYDSGASVRRYGDADVRRLRFIRQAQQAGFSLQEIGELLRLDAGSDHARARDLARTRLVALDSQIAALKTVRAALHRLVEDCARQEDGPCPILDAFDEQARPPPDDRRRVRPL